MIQHRRLLVLAVILAGTQATTASANVITDWDEIGVKTVQPIGVQPPINPGLFFRAMAMMHLAMFNAVNSIDPRFQPYKFQKKPSPETSPEAAAASAAANVLAGVVPKFDLRATLTSYLASFPDSEAKDRGVKLGGMSQRRCWSCAPTTDRRRRTLIGQ